MRPIRPALLALAVAILVVVPATAGAATAGFAAPAATGAGAPGVDAGASVGDAVDALPVIRAQPNTTNYLDIRGNDVQRGGYGEASLDGSTAVGAAVTRLRSDYASQSFDVAYANASTSEERVAVVRTEVNRLAERIDALETRQAVAIVAYNDGRISTREFVAELATVDAGARAVEAQFDRVVSRASLVMPSQLETSIDNLRADLIPLQGPVRARAARAMSGDQSPTVAYALTSPTGIVVTTTENGRFYREAYLAANRNPGGEDAFLTEDDPTGLNPANDRARELYPWAYRGTSPELKREGSTSVYTVLIDHSQGQLLTHIDGATRDVFSETQILRTNRVPTETVTNRTTSVTLRVETGFGTGPMHVVVTDPATNESLNATVLVDGHRVGTTGIDGELWTTAPHGSGTVTVRTPEDVASVEVAPR